MSPFPIPFVPSIERIVNNSVAANYKLETVAPRHATNQLNIYLIAGGNNSEQVTVDCDRLRQLSTPHTSFNSSNRLMSA